VVGGKEAGGSKKKSYMKRHSTSQLVGPFRGRKLQRIRTPVLKGGGRTELGKKSTSKGPCFRSSADGPRITSTSPRDLDSQGQKKTSAEVGRGRREKMNPLSKMKGSRGLLWENL